MQFLNFLNYSQEVINAFLESIAGRFLSEPEKLFIAIKYSLLNKGKRVRPALVYALAKLFGMELTKLNAVAASIEIIHCYSLVHDDLPAIDNDDLRRGQLSCHKAFDEATAILVGDGLQSLAFRILADPQFNKFSSLARSNMVIKLANLSGVFGMIRGQARDLASENKIISLDELEEIHKDKTGALINCCLELFMLAYEDGQPNVDVEHVKKLLLSYSNHLAMIFQIKDDLLDLEQSSGIIGKPNGSDQKLNKATFVSILGLVGAKEQLEKHYCLAKLALKDLSHCKNSFDIIGIKLLYDFIDYFKDRRF